MSLCKSLKTTLCGEQRRPDIKRLLRSVQITNSRFPQLYGAPKVHKEGCPIRPVVTFYNTPLSALHKTLSVLIKPLTNNPMKLRNTQDFVNTPILHHKGHERSSQLCLRQFIFEFNQEYYAHSPG